ncbi:MAG: hypothetical protein WKF89_19550 [Chitinophagaceae bacterium]
MNSVQDMAESEDGFSKMDEKEVKEFITHSIEYPSATFNKLSFCLASVVIISASAQGHDAPPPKKVSLF